MASSSRSLLDRMSAAPNDAWGPEADAAADAFQPTHRRPKRPREVELDPEYRFTPWLGKVAAQADEDKAQRLHDEIVAYVNYVTPTHQEKTTRTQVFEHIKKTIKTRFPRSEVYLFGSVAHDLCLPDGDLDVVVELPGVDHPLDKKNCLFNVSGALKASGATHDVFVNHFAKVPVATFVTVPNFGSYSFDVGINNTDGLKAVTIIGSFLETMPALRPLVLVLKSFLKQRKLASAASGGLSSYSVICATISFLQLNPTNLPQDSLNKPLETKSLGILLMDFLLYFGSTFPLDDCYISVTQGKHLPKESADWITGRNKLSIECLVDPENDVGKSAGKIHQILETFRDAHKLFETLTLSPNESADILGDGNLARVTQKTLDQREHISKLATSGNLFKRVPVDRYADYRSQRRGGYNDRQAKSQYRPPPRQDAYVDDSYRSRDYGRDSGSGSRDSYGSSKRRRY
ncbi:Nucleotidyltransferase [Athelia psychrophila]|uniref:polynucleotide adenylyltransferase n=1 Tax=Athelia psychrophila TaxID=1759441 RepID=A0A166ED35_9AGAM|nr:Nucleotidyltransferase [Fibularhizoctonia sp. CBS 109695]